MSIKDKGYRILLAVVLPGLEYVHSRVSDSVSLRLENVIARLRGRQVRFSSDSLSSDFIASERGRRRYFEIKQRGFWCYRAGLLSRAEFISKSYCLSHVKFSESDIVIDCGANAGDLFLALSGCIEPGNYIAIEPNPSDFRILSKNVPDCRRLNEALGNRIGEIEFFVCTEKGDSSIIEPESYSERVKVHMTTLDELIRRMQISKVKLLKIEGEGFEPEILEGAHSALCACEFVAVDGGYERGIDGDQTFTEVTNFLVRRGFRMVDVYFPWCRALFVNNHYAA